MADRPPRPSEDRPELTGFTRQEMVRWLSPGELADAALRVVLSGIFGTYSDKREIQGALGDDQPFAYAERSELWLDYVADLGDGFGPTYTLATLLAQEKLDLPGPRGAAVPTRRGKVLVMGGDQVYPTASTVEYENRLVGPYRAALPFTEADHPNLFAVPGNHDWYDGLTAFMRVFCQQKWVGGWHTCQRRSYFALELPHRWWLWGIDIQFDTYVDEPQLRYFRETVGPKLRPGDSIILCSAKPSWVEADDDCPDAFSTLDYFERTVVAPRQAAVRLALAGDAHHYARYRRVGDTAQKITAGGGGAYLSATHHLREHLTLPHPASRDPGRSPPTEWERAATYPTPEQSRRLRFGIAALARKNPSFCVLLAGVHLLYAWMIQAGVREPGQSFAEVVQALSLPGSAAGLVRSPLALLASLVLVAGLAGFTRAPSPWLRWGLGAAHGAAHLAVIVAVVRLAEVPFSSVDGLPFVAGYLPAVAAAGGLLGACVMAGYLLVADLARCNTNELFAAQRLEGYKNFLRLHLDEEGVLTVHPVKVERTVELRRWRLRGGGDQDDPWFEPQGDPPRAELIEEPVRIDPGAAP